MTTEGKADTDAVDGDDRTPKPGYGRRVTMMRQSVGRTREDLQDAAYCEGPPVNDQDMKFRGWLWAALSAHAAQYAFLRGDLDLSDAPQQFRTIAGVVSLLAAARSGD